MPEEVRQRGEEAIDLMKSLLKARWGDVDRSLAVAQQPPTVVLVVGINGEMKPGAYTVALTVEGRTWTQPLTVLRAPTFRPAETVDPEDVRLFLKALRR